MDHSYFRDKVSAFLDRGLSDEEMFMMAEHISECPECQQLLAEYERLEQLTDQSRDLADDDYWEQSARKIEQRLGFTEKQTPITPIIPKRKRSGLGWKLIGAAASVALLAFIGLHQSDILSPIKPQSDIPTFTGGEPRQGVEIQTEEFDYDAVPVPDLQEESKLADDVQLEESAEVMAPFHRAVDDLVPAKETTSGEQIEKHDDETVIDGIALGEVETKLSKPAAEPKIAASREIDDAASVGAGTAGADVAPSPVVADIEVTTADKVKAEASRIVKVLAESDRAVGDVSLGTGDSGRREKAVVAAPAQSYFFEPGMATSREEEMLPSDTLGLAYWRSRRDSLSSQLNARVEIRSFAAPKKDRLEISQTTPPEETEEQRLKDQGKYFEAVYMVGKLTSDEDEFYRSADTLRAYLEDFDAPLKDVVRRYLKRLED